MLLGMLTFESWHPCIYVYFQHYRQCQFCPQLAGFILNLRAVSHSNEFLQNTVWKKKHSCFIAMTDFHDKVSFFLLWLVVVVFRESLETNGLCSSPVHQNDLWWFQFELNFGSCGKRVSGPSKAKFENLFTGCKRQWSLIKWHTVVSLVKTARKEKVSQPYLI